MKGAEVESVRMPTTAPEDRVHLRTGFLTEDNNDRTRKGQPDMKLEAVVLSVSDVDRAKAFYENLGWRLDIDVAMATTSTPCR